MIAVDTEKCDGQLGQTFLSRNHPCLALPPQHKNLYRASELLCQCTRFKTQMLIKSSGGGAVWVILPVCRYRDILFRISERQHIADHILRNVLPAFSGSVCSFSHDCKTVNCSGVWNQCSPLSITVNPQPKRRTNSSTVVRSVRLSLPA